MEQRLTIELKITKEERIYTFTMPYGVSHGEAYDVAHEFLANLVEIHKQQTELLKRQEEATGGISDGGQ
jgi:lysyl-tRNA synthetase class I